MPVTTNLSVLWDFLLFNGVDCNRLWRCENKWLHFDSVVLIHVWSSLGKNSMFWETFYIPIFPWNVTICEPKWTRVQPLLHLLLYYTTQLKVLSTAAFGQPGNCTWNWPWPWSEWHISHLAGMKVNERSKETASQLLYIHHHRHVASIYKTLICLQPMVTREGQRVM